MTVLRTSILCALALVRLSAALHAAKPVTDGLVPSADEYTVLVGKVTIGTIDAHMGCRRMKCYENRIAAATRVSVALRRVVSSRAPKRRRRPSSLRLVAR